MASELPKELLEETQSAINHVVGLQLSPSQWSVVDARFHEIDWATKHDDTAALTEALSNLADLAGSDGESAVRAAPPRGAPPLRAELSRGNPPRVARFSLAILLSAVATVVVGLLGVFAVGTSLSKRSVAPTPAPPSPTPPGPATSFHAGFIGLVLGGVLLAIIGAALIAVMIRRRQSRINGAPAGRPAMPVGVLDAAVDIQVPPPQEIREFANRLVDTLSARGGFRSAEG
ncbi:hypothetical protein AWB92_11590 [Mycobacterium sp. IEC1808]|uniref:hypothetical protein n=1 Tax=Mycobacterium sp. IEC1808 TaxID=1743230 RepID=UPI000A14F144|nr:hypothetical protein [Mycobacterium sp. IEC1808]ORW94386.1 hypothetical protein AWB92_11590 [Mycobacterium sp. IEC1808]